MLKEMKVEISRIPKLSLSTSNSVKALIQLDKLFKNVTINITA
jgi:hypothetical protein